MRVTFAAIDNFSGTTLKKLHTKVSSIEVANVCSISGNTKSEIKLSSMYVRSYIELTPEWIRVMCGLIVRRVDRKKGCS